jgi:hypothetical protein
MVQVDHHDLPCRFALLEHGVDVVLNDLGHTAATGRAQAFVDVPGTEVDRELVVGVAELLSLDQRDLAFDVELRSDFIEPAEADFLSVILRTGFDPVGELRLEFVEGDAAAFCLVDFDPPLGVREDVVVGECEEVVSLVALPQAD